MLRIGIDTRDLNIAKTGARTYLEEILVALPRIAPQHQFVRLQPASYRQAGERLWTKALNQWNFIKWKQFDLPQQARYAGCHLLLCTDYAVPLFSPCKTVPVFYDTAIWANPEHYNAIWRILMKLLIVPAANKSPVVVTISEFSRAEIARYTGISPAKIAAIPIAAKTLTCARSSPAQIHNRMLFYNIQPDEPFALHVGVLEKRKNLVRLVQAFARFVSLVNRPYKLVLVGQAGPKHSLNDAPSIQAAIEQLNLQERVRWVGHVPDQDLAAFYHSANFLVFPSSREGFGIPILEAFNNNLPVAASNSTAIPEVAGDAALLFDPTDTESIAQAMVRIATNCDLRRELVQRGRQRAALYSWDKTATQLVNLFEQICANTHNPNSR